MPSPFVKKIAKEIGVGIPKIEKLWDKAKTITTETFGVKEKDFGDREYAYTTGIVKKMLGVSEDSWKPIDFLKSEKSAKEFIETVISADFNIKTTNISKNVDKNIKNKEKEIGKIKAGEKDNSLDQFLGLDGIKIEGKEKKKINDVEWVDKLMGLDGFKIIEKKFKEYAIDIFTGVYQNRKISIDQHENGMYGAEIRDEYGDVESATTGNTMNQIWEWFDYQDIDVEKIIWDDKINRSQ